MESRKVLFYICAMKTLKISEGVHFELKRYVANNPKTKMGDVAGFSIMTFLRSQNHKFTSPAIKKPKK